MFFGNRYSYDDHRQPPIFQQPAPPYGQYPLSTPNHRPTPYEVYAKPPQPLDILSGSSFTGQTNSPAQGILGVFTDANGQVDFDKAMTTINQLASTYHQLSPIVKEFSAILKAFR